MARRGRNRSGISQPVTRHLGGRVARGRIHNGRFVGLQTAKTKRVFYRTEEQAAMNRFLGSSIAKTVGAYAVMAGAFYAADKWSNKPLPQAKSRQVTKKTSTKIGKTKVTVNRKVQQTPRPQAQGRITKWTSDYAQNVVRVRNDKNIRAARKVASPRVRRAASYHSAKFVNNSRIRSQNRYNAKRAPRTRRDSKGRFAGSFAR